MKQTQSIASVGNVAAQLQRPVAQILDVAERLGIRPAMNINRVPHFNDEDVSRIAGQIDRNRSTDAV